jgi:hypothetical protein
MGGARVLSMVGRASIENDEEDGLELGRRPFLRLPVSTLARIFIM